MSKSDASNKVAADTMDLLVIKVGRLVDDEGIDIGIAIADVMRGAAIYLAVSAQSLFGTKEAPEAISMVINKALEASPGLIAKAKKKLGYK